MKEPRMANSPDSPTERTRRFLTDWFARLEATGFDGGVFLGALSDDRVVEFHGVGGVDRNGTDHTLRYCWVVRVVDDRIREVVGYYDQVKVDELFS